MDGHMHTRAWAIILGAPLAAEGKALRCCLQLACMYVGTHEQPLLLACTLLAIGILRDARGSHDKEEPDRVVALKHTRIA